MSYGIQIRNPNGDLVINSEGSVILNKQTIPVINFTVQSSTTEDITIEDVGDSNKIAVSISPTTTGLNANNISVSASGNTLSVTNTNTINANFDLFVFRLG